MARMIYQKDSTAMHLRMGWRHVRLCGRVPGAEPFGTALKPFLDKLENKDRERQKAEDYHDETYDVVVLNDIYLDNIVRTTFERVAQYDREHLTRVQDLLFPERGYSRITGMALSEEPQEVNNLIEKIAGLEEGHPLKELIAPLREKMEASEAAWKEYRQAGIRLDGIHAAEEHERLAVRHQYECNWLDARKQYGIAVADSIFPKVKSRKSTSPHDSDDAPAADQA